MDSYLQKESEWENANKEDVRLCNRGKRRVCIKREKIYLLLREERREVYEFIKEQLRKKYIGLLKLS